MSRHLRSAHFGAFVIASVLFVALPANAQWATNGTHIFNTNSGNVGIGTSNPQSTLHIFRSTTPTLQVSDSAAGHFRFGKPAVNEGDFTYNAAFNGTNWNLDSTVLDGKDFAIAESGFYFYTFTAGANPRTARVDMTVDRLGNVGIGTASPTQKLHVIGGGLFTGDLAVSGNLNVTGNIAAKYQDVAEWVPSTVEIEAGTVVVLDPNHANHVVASASPYDTTVAGVISAQPGVVLGEPGSGKSKVATTGRVRVKVDARENPIHVGDLLVTSSIGGFAMKSQPLDLGGVQIHRPGTIVGKALESLDKGTGEILVLLTLQ